MDQIYRIKETVKAYPFNGEDDECTAILDAIESDPRFSLLLCNKEYTKKSAEDPMECTSLILTLLKGLHTDASENITVTIPTDCFLLISQPPYDGISATSEADFEKYYTIEKHPMICGHCGGTGLLKDPKEPCTYCEGSGFVWTETPGFDPTPYPRSYVIEPPGATKFSVCPDCGGLGATRSSKVASVPITCSRCGGRGHIEIIEEEATKE